MTERTATICGYTLFGVIFLAVALGVWTFVRSRAEPVVVEDSTDPVVVTAWIGTEAPATLYVQAKIKPGYHIYSIGPKTPEPIRTVLEVTPGEFKTASEWFAVVQPKVVNLPGFGDLEEHFFGAAWGIRLDSKVPLGTLKIRGRIQVAPCNDNSCQIATWIEFEAQVP